MRLFLGFDDTCPRCTAMGRKIQDLTNGRIQVMPLRNPAMAKWRADHLGADAPWKPTLVSQMDDGEIEVTVGWSMGRILLHEFGFTDSMKILAIVGNESQKGNIGNRVYSSVSRRSFGRMFFGAAFGAAAIASVGRAGATPKSALENSRFLTGREAELRLSELLRTIDVQNVLQDLGESFSSTFENAFIQVVRPEEAESSYRLPVASVREGSVDGKKYESAAVYVPFLDVVLSTSVEALGEGLSNIRSAVWSLDGHELLTSVNGQLLERTSQDRLERALYAGEEVCTGCENAGPGSVDKNRDAYRCEADYDMACVTSLAGCGRCATTCVSTAGLGCIFCVTTGCGALIANGDCCNDKRPPVHSCERCMTMT